MAPHVLLTVALMALMTAPVDGSTFRILGGIVKEYNKAGDDYWGSAHSWGQSGTDNYSKYIEINACYCDTKTKDGKDGFCKQFLTVSTIDSNAQEHYQLVGSELRINDKHDVHIQTNYANGITRSSEIIQSISVGNCETWCEKKGDFRNGDLYFYVNKTTQPSSTDDFSTISLKQGHEDQHHDEEFVEYHDDTAMKRQFAGVRRWDEAWGTKSYMHSYVWIAPTVLVDVKPLYDLATSENGIVKNVKKTVSLRNEGTGITSDDMPALGTTVEETYTNTARFLSSYDFGFNFQESISVTVNALVYEMEAGLQMSQSYDYHSEEEMTTTQTVKGTTQVTWPDQCPAGMQITYVMEDLKEEQMLPVELTFERAGSRWNEMDTIKASLQKIQLIKTQCCIYQEADESCSGVMPMCGGSSSDSKEEL